LFIITAAPHCHKLVSGKRRRCQTQPGHYRNLRTREKAQQKQPFTAATRMRESAFRHF
jgi:hypothetical protein